jgi:hypothetical protein
VITCQPCWRPRARPGMAFGCVPLQRSWTRRRSDARPATPSEGVARDSVPTTMAAGCVPGDGVRGRSRRWPVQARDALPVMARGCPIVRVGSRAAAITGLNHALAAHPWFARARPTPCASAAARRAARDNAKIAPISRAEGGRTACAGSAAAEVVTYFVVRRSHVSSLA